MRGARRRLRLGRRSETITTTDAMSNDTGVSNEAIVLSESPLHGKVDGVHHVQLLRRLTPQDCAARGSMCRNIALPEAWVIIMYYSTVEIAFEYPNEYADDIDMAGQNRRRRSIF